REFPEARTPEDELSDEPWFPVAENDVFPEEFGRFLGMPGELREEFVRWHGELLTARWWQEMQQRTRAGELVDVIPYREDSRLHPRRGR
ncbi:MAG: bifunctional isocitrate dehydrogenase kinase/phosphatase, partial [Acidobacteria bacterium]